MASATRAGRCILRRSLALVALACWVVHSPPVQADPYPSRTIRIVIPSAPNGAGDILARELGDRLSAALRVPVVAENRPGASGIIGNDYVAHAPPDGYTLLFATLATHVIAAELIANLPYDPQRDFSPVINAGYTTSVIVVNSKLPVHTLAEFIAYARARPDKLNYASSGIGSANNIDTEAFLTLTGLRLLHVPYRGTADGYRALLADEVQVMVGAITSALPHVQSGRLRALAVLTDRRSPLLPEVPTLTQTGLGSVDLRRWMGVLVPAGTPREIIAQLNATLDAILHEPSMRAWMERQGFDLAGGSAQAYGEILQADFVKWARTARRVGVRAE